MRFHDRKLVQARTRVRHATSYGRNEPELTAALKKARLGDVEAHLAVRALTEPVLRAFVVRAFHKYGGLFIEEVAERTFTDSYARRAEYDEKRGNYRNWLFNLARTEANRIRAEWYLPRPRKSPPPVSIDEPDENGEPIDRPDIQNSDPARLYEAQRCFEVVRQEFEALPPDMQKCLELRVIRGMKLEDAAREAGLSVNQLRYKCRIGQERMRRRLARQGIKFLPPDLAFPRWWYATREAPWDKVDGESDSPADSAVQAPPSPDTEQEEQAD